MHCLTACPTSTKPKPWAPSQGWATGATGRSITARPIAGSSFSGQKKASFTSGLPVKQALPSGHSYNLITIWNLASRKSALGMKSPWTSTRTICWTGGTASATLRCATTTSTKTGTWPPIHGRGHFAMAASSKRAWASLGNAPGLPFSPVTENTSPGASAGAWAW